METAWTRLAQQAAGLVKGAVAEILVKMLYISYFFLFAKICP